MQAMARQLWERRARASGVELPASGSASPNVKD
jgi:hypothetical protein